MAEGKHFSRTLDGGSEALFDHVCTQCRTHGSTQEATDFCQDCKQFMCKICGKYHIRNLEAHTLVSVASLQQPKTILPAIRPVPDVAKCQNHPDYDIEMYCGTHDMVYCYCCIAKEHRSCSDVKEIGDVAHKSNQSTLQALVAEITRVSKQLHTTKLEISKDLKRIQNMKDSLQEEIKSLRKQFNLQLDALEQKILAELDAEQNKLENETGNDITAVDNLITASDKGKPVMTSHFDEKHIFIAEKLGRVVVTDVNNFLKNSNVFKHPTLKFEPNDILRGALTKSDSMGKISRIYTKQTQIRRCKYTVESMNEINVRVSSDKKVCHIYDMCQLRDGTLLLIDNNNNNLKRLNNELNVKDFLDLKAEPVGLCSVSSTEVAVGMEDRTLHFISVGKSITYQRRVKKINKAMSRMACCNNQLWITGAGDIHVYSLSGTFMKTIESDSQGRKIFPIYYPMRIAVSNDDTKVYVTALGDRVVVFNNNGDVIKELHDLRVTGTGGVLVTDDDIVLVAGSLSNNVVMFDRDGNSRGELVSSKDMLYKPWSMCYDRERCRLLVGYKSDRAHIQLFQLS